MAKLVFGMNQSLDGYADHMAFAPGLVLFRHFIEQARGLTGSVSPLNQNSDATNTSRSTGRLNHISAPL